MKNYLVKNKLINIVKSLKFIPNTRGLYEACDGSKLPIGPVYYMEFLMYTDPSMPEFINPSEEELDIAQKNGNCFNYSRLHSI
jgi:hypothetical protein